MNIFIKKSDYRQTPLLLGIQIFLLVLIIIGIILFCTQDLWVPKLVNYILTK